MKTNKFIGVITSDKEMFALAVNILTPMFPDHKVVETPIEVESEADAINLHDGIMIKILPADVLDDFTDVDGTIRPVNEEDLYYKLEAIQTSLYEQQSS